MKAEITSREERFDIRLNIYLISFLMPNNNVKDNDQIQLIITTFPEKYKQQFCLKYKKIKSPNQVFSINITNQTKTILMIFKKKCFMSKDSIIAWTTINYSQFPEIPQSFDRFSENITSDIKTLNIFEPVQRKITENEDNRKYKFTESSTPVFQKVNGQVEVQFMFSKPFILKSHPVSKNCRDNNKIETIQNEKKGRKIENQNNYVCLE